MGKTWTPQQVAQCLALYHQDLSLREIGRRMGSPHKPIAKYLDLAGLPRPPQAQRGKRNYFWKDGRTVDADGYVLVYAPDHPYRNYQNKMREHRLVMEKKLGRYLEPDEVVDHINGVRDDNRPENLRLFSSNAEHLAVTLKGRCPQWSEEGRQRLLEICRANNTRYSENHPKLGADQ